MRDGAIVIGVLFLIALMLWAVEKFQKYRRDLKGPLYIWRCHRSQGGGVVETPHSMTKSEAVEWCGKNLGFIMYVDEIRNFIFYRARD